MGADRSGRASRSRAVGLVAALVVLGAGPVRAQSLPVPVVEPSRQLTTDPRPDRLYVSPVVAVDPTDPSAVVVAAADARNGGCGLLVSHDGGGTFAQAAKTFMPADEPFCIQLNFGPAIQLAFNPTGGLYVATAGSSPAKGHPLGPVDALTIHTADLGKTSEAFTVEKSKDVPYTSGTETRTGISSLGNNSIAIDSVNPNRIYRSFRFRTRGINGQSSGQPDRPRIAVSNDAGKTWAPSIDPLDELGAGVYGGDLPMLAAGPGGVVYGFTRERLRAAAAGQPPNTKQRVFMSKSTDGGKTWKTTVAYDDANGLSDPGVAVDPRTGRIYVVFESGVANGTEHAFFMSSADGGATWIKPVDLTDEGGQKHNQSVPGVSVAPDGRIDVAWFDFRNDPFFVPKGTVKQRYSDVYGASSGDGGKTWTKNYRVSDRSSDRNIGVTFDNEDVRGPFGIASTKDAALITWADSRAGALPEFDVEDVYFTRVRFGAATTEADSTFDTGSALLGAGGALALAGLGLLVVTGRSGPRRTG